LHSQPSERSGPDPLPAYTLSPECQVLEDAMKDDTAYLDYVNDSELVSRIRTLASTCRIADASLLNQLILKGPKPKSESLLKSRDYLILATTYCQAPNTAAHTRTRDDLETSEKKRAEYIEELDSCEGEFENVASTGAGSLLTTFSGNGDDVVSFTAESTGLKIFTVEYSGNARLEVMLIDEKGDPVELLVNETGSYSGKHSEKLSSGNYFLDITADGQWEITIESIS
jgi:hypothetical protein